MRTQIRRFPLGRALQVGALAVSLITAACSSDEAAESTSGSTTGAVATTAVPTTVTDPEPEPSTTVTETTETTEATETTTTPPATTTEPAPTSTEPQSTDPPADQPTFTECAAITGPLTFATAEQAASCDWSTGPLECGDPSVNAFRRELQDEMCRRASVFDLGIYGGGAFTEWFHEPGVVDEVTGEPGLSYFALSLGPLDDTSGVFTVTADCGGRIVTSSTPFVGRTLSLARGPLFNLGTCTLIEVIARPDGGGAVLLDPAFFGGGSFTVTADDFDVPDVEQQFGEFVEAAELLTGAVGDSDSPLGPPGSSIRFFLETAANRPVDCISLHALHESLAAVGCLPVDGATWTLEALRPTSLDSFPTPLMQSFGSISQIGTTGIISGPHELLFPCGPGPIGFTICPEGQPPLDATGLLVVTLTFDEFLYALPTPPDPNDPTSGVEEPEPEPEGKPESDELPPVPPPGDPNDPTFGVEELGLEFPGGAIGITTEPTKGSVVVSDDGDTRARFVVRGDTVYGLIPIDELQGTVAPGELVLSVDGTALEPFGAPPSAFSFLELRP